jgi:hypothetical protein
LPVKPCGRCGTRRDNPLQDLSIAAAGGSSCG